MREFKGNKGRSAIEPEYVRIRECTMEREDEAEWRALDVSRSTAGRAGRVCVCVCVGGCERAPREPLDQC